MFASIYGRTVPEFQGDAGQALLIDLAFTFSPLVEQTTMDTVVLDVAGQDLLFGSPANSRSVVDDNAEIDSARALATEIVRRAAQIGFEVNVSVAANPDAAIHSARSFKGVTVIPAGREFLQLGSLSLKMLDYSLAEIEKERVEEIRETLELWGLRTFNEFARLPLAGVAEAGPGRSASAKARSGQKRSPDGFGATSARLRAITRVRASRCGTRAALFYSFSAA